MSSNVTCIIPSKNRYHTTLPLAIMAMANQTLKVDKFILFDDGDKIDLRNDPLYQYIFKALDLKGIKWEVVFGVGKGQVWCHQKSIELVETEWIWRLDDDNVPDPDALEKLMEVVDDKTGAVGGLVIDPKQSPSCSIASSKIEDIYLGVNEQWFAPSAKEVYISYPDHLYSTFIYRKTAAKHGYCMELSPAGHREETMFTHEMKRAGWDLKFNPSARTMHFRYPDGGIRVNKDLSMWQYDEQIFTKRMIEWGVVPKQYKTIVLNCGLGDHIVFKKIWPEVKAKHKNILLALCYPELFEDETDVKIISIAEAQMISNLDESNVYKYLWDRSGTKMNLEQAYRGMYL